MFQIYKSNTTPLAHHKLIWLKRIAAALFFVLLCYIIISLNTKIQLPLIYKMRGLPAVDKIAHFGVYGSLALIVNLALGFAHFNFPWRSFDHRYFQIGSFAVLLFSLGEELSQQFFPSRTMDVWDAVVTWLVSPFSHG